MADNIGPIKDPSIRLRPKASFASFITERVTDIGQAPQNIVSFVSRKVDILTLDDLDWLHAHLCSADNTDLLEGGELDAAISAFMRQRESLAKTTTVKKGVTLHELLQGCEVILPQNEVLPRNPQLEARVERLRKQQAEREYQSMTQNVNTTKKFATEDTLAYQMNMMNRHLIGVAQFLISVATGFAFGFLGVPLIIGDMEFGFRLLLGVGCATVIAIAEIYFLVKHLSEDDNALQSENNTQYQQPAATSSKAAN